MSRRHRVIVGEQNPALAHHRPPQHEVVEYVLAVVPAVNVDHAVAVAFDFQPGENRVTVPLQFANWVALYPLVELGFLGFVLLPMVNAIERTVFPGQDVAAKPFRREPCTNADL